MTNRPDAGSPHWRTRALLVVLAASLVPLILLPPIAQAEDYHAFADQRVWLGLPNAWNVLSNVGFLIVGLLGLGRRVDPVSPAERAWTVVFAGVTLVALGSGYYHWQPNSQTLVWDRLPMSMAFMALLIALLAQFVHRPLLILLWPAIGAGLLSVLVWQLSGDLRLYAWVQFAPLLLIVFIALAYPMSRSSRRCLLAALFAYALAKVLEQNDRQIFEITDAHFGGHAGKHVLAGLACYCLLGLHASFARDPAVRDRNRWAVDRP